MTIIKLFKKGDIFVGFECSGHTGYNEFGEDILCATISGITQAITLGISKVCGAQINLVKKDSKGYLKVELHKSLDNDVVNKTQVLFQTLKLSIEDLLEMYSDYILMEVIENVY